MKYTTILIIATLFFFGCTDATSVVTPPEPKKSLNFKWEHNYNQDELALYIDPVMHNGNPIYCFRNKSNKDELAYINVLSGEKIWGIKLDDAVKKQVIHGDRLFLSTETTNQIIVVDLNYRKVLKTYSGFGNILYTFDVINNNLYFGVKQDNSNTLFELPGIDQTLPENARKVFDFPMKDGLMPSIHIPSVWVDSMGKNVLMVAVGYYGDKERHTLYAIDGSSDTIRWQISGENLTTPNYKGVVVYDDYVYLTTNRNVYCFDAKTGDRLWEKQMDLHTSTKTKPFVCNDKLIVFSDHDYIWIFDITNREIKPEKPTEVGARITQGSDYVTIYNQTMYITSYASGYLFGLNLITNDLKFEKLTPNRLDFLNDNVLVNKDLNQIIVADEKSIFCIDIGDLFL